MSTSLPPPSVTGASVPAVPSEGVWSWLPGLWTLRHYRRAWLGRDLSAGLVLTALLIPAGMGYAEASGLPAVTGLYATILPLLAYALVGPSRILVYGPDSGLAALVAVAVVGPAAGDPERAIVLASMLALMTGVICMVGGVLKAGFLTDLLSKPVRVGYMNGIALTVLVSQLPKMLGFSVDAHDVPGGMVELVRGVVAGRIQALPFAIGAASFVVIVGGRALASRVPWVLVAVAGSAGAVAVLGLGTRLAVVGAVPRGLPLPQLPLVRLDDLPPLAIAALGIAMVSFADTSVLSRAFAARQGYRVDPNRELFALGATNFAAGLFRGFPISSSASRTPVAESAGSRTQLTGVVAAAAVTAVLLVAPGLLAHLPRAALAAVVVAAAVRIVEIQPVTLFFRVRRSDFVLSIVAFLAVAGLGVIAGIGVAVGLSLLDVVRRAWRPHHAVLGRAEGVKGYHDVERYKSARQVPGLVLFRWDAPLFFANADLFRTRVLALAKPPVRRVVLAAEPITDVDSTAAEMLDELHRELSLSGVDLAFAELKDPVKDRLERYGLPEKVGRDRFFPTIGMAVHAYLAEHEVPWHDWEEESDGLGDEVPK